MSRMKKTDLPKAEETTSMFLKGMKVSLKNDLKKLKEAGGYRTYVDLFEALVKMAHGA